MKKPEDLAQIFNTQLIFQSQDQEEETFHQKDLIQIFPYGLSLTQDVQRPFILMRDESHQHTLPVAVSPIEAGVLLSQNNKASLPSTPHRFTEMLLGSLNIQIKQCVFVEIKGMHQYVRLYVSGHPLTNSFKMRADEAISLCLYLEVPIFTTRGFIAKSRVMSAKVEGMAKDLHLDPSLVQKGVLH